MPNRRDRQPNITELLIGIAIIGVLGYLFFPNFLSDLYARLNPTTAASGLTDYSLNNMSSDPLNLPVYTSPVTSGSDSTLNLGSGNNALASGYWVLFVANGTSDQLSLSAEDYTFLQRMIQSDNQGNPTQKIFLVANGQLQQFSISNEIYTILMDLQTIYKRTVNGASSPTSALPATGISETLFVSSPSTTGFTVSLTPALNGLSASNFKLVNNSGYLVSITGATTSDGGATYVITAALSAGQTYSLTATYTGYTFGTAQSITVPSSSASSITNGEIFSISNPSATGFTVMFSPALNGLTASNFSLIHSSGIPVSITGATTSDNGTSYAVTATLTSGQTYNLSITSQGYTIGTNQSVVVP